MRNLLKKEFLLSLNPNVIVMGLLGLLVCVPSFPAFAAFFYILGGLASIMPRAAADKDLEYTAMLPIPKHDVVVSKMLLFAALELGTIVFTVPFALLRVFVFDPATLQSMIGSSTTQADLLTMYAMGPSLSTYGFAFITFGIFNILFFPWFYKNPTKINAPQLVSTIVTMLISVLFVLAPFVPGLQNYLIYATLSDPVSLYAQCGILFGGLLLGAGLTFWAGKLASKHFEKVDI
ncbi:MAG: ABC-2 transporter permease [Bacilli bacterium]|jgi:hypothetical protein|nr:ABC-2 transporter permease [Bacilli bacterium]